MEIRRITRLFKSLSTCVVAFSKLRNILDYELVERVAKYHVTPLHTTKRLNQLVNNFQLHNNKVEVIFWWIFDFNEDLLTFSLFFDENVIEKASIALRFWKKPEQRNIEEFFFRQPYETDLKTRVCHCHDWAKITLDTTVWKNMYEFNILCQINCCFLFFFTFQSWHVNCYGNSSKRCEQYGPRISAAWRK